MSWSISFAKIEVMKIDSGRGKNLRPMTPKVIENVTKELRREM